MRNINKRSDGYKTRAEKKKEKNELKRQSKMEKKYLVGLYDDYRVNGSLNTSLIRTSCKLIGTFSTEPNYEMIDIDNGDSCIVKTDGNYSIKVEVWEIPESYVDKIEDVYNYYTFYQEYPQDYKKQTVLTPFGEVTMYFADCLESAGEIVISGDWIEHLNCKKVKSNKKENVL